MCTRASTKYAKDRIADQRNNKYDTNGNGNTISERFDIASPEQTELSDVREISEDT